MNPFAEETKVLHTIPRTQCTICVLRYSSEAKSQALEMIAKGLLKENIIGICPATQHCCCIKIK